MKKKQYKSVITYGGSMGGWAALAFSKELQANKVIAFCPQIILSRWPYYANYRSKLTFNELFDLPHGLSSHSKVIAFYAQDYQEDKNAIEIDLKNIAYKIGLSSLQSYPIPHNKHVIMPLLNNTKIADGSSLFTHKQ